MDLMTPEISPATPVRVKICGLTRREDALLAVELGADALGFVFYRESPRYISPEAAAEIAGELPPHVARVGVFVDPLPEQVNAIAGIAGLHAVQIHGLSDMQRLEEIRLPVVLAHRVGHAPLRLWEIAFPPPVVAHLLDAYHPRLHGGTGRTFDWHQAVELARRHRIILAGGLTPENVPRAVKLVQPYAVDVSSGVEQAPGIKDRKKLTTFLENLKEFRHGATPAGSPQPPFPLA